MQNEKILIELGFRKLNRTGEYFYRGKHQKFTANVISCNGPVYVQLNRVCPQIDDRPYSPNKGYHFRHMIKDCCSIGSVERAIKKYDLPEDQIEDTLTGIYIKNQLV